MKQEVALSAGVEKERQQRLAETSAEHGPGWQEQYGPGSFGCHEFLDRSALAAELVEDRLLGHPACALRPDWYALAEQAAAALRELYQRIGAEHLGEDSGSPSHTSQS